MLGALVPGARCRSDQDNWQAADTRGGRRAVATQRQGRKTERSNRTRQDNVQVSQRSGVKGKYDFQSVYGVHPVEVGDLSPPKCHIWYWTRGLYRFLLLLQLYQVQKQSTEQLTSTVVTCSGRCSVVGWCSASPQPVNQNGLSITSMAIVDVQV